MPEIHAIRVPQWGLEMTEGAVAEWRVGVGDRIRKGTEIVDIETAKIINVVEAGADLPGVVRRLVANVGDTLPVGAVLAVVAEPSVSEAELDAFLGNAPASAPAVVETASEPAQARVPAALPSASATPALPATAPATPAPRSHPSPVSAMPAAVQPVTPAPAAAAVPTKHEDAFDPPAEMPHVPEPEPPSLSDEERAALVAANANVAASPIARRLANRLGIALTPLRGTGVHGRISVEDVQVVAWDRGHVLPVPGAAALPAAGDIAMRNAHVHATPVARRVANRHGIDLASVHGSGRRGRIGVADLPLKAALTHAADTSAAHARIASTPNAPASTTPSSAPAPATQALPPGAELLPFTPMRKAIAAGLVRSKQTIPHFYLTADLPLDGVLALRTQMNRTADDGGKLSINDFVLRATALALAAVPDANVHHSDAGTLRFRDVHLAVAVAIDGGLVTPVVRDAHTKTITRISQEVSALAAKAKHRSLAQSDLADATFTVSNLGMYGIRNFDAVINPPQGGILAVGAVRREAVETGDGIAFRSVMSVTLSCDHRVIDGAVGAGFLAELRRRFEQPHMLLL